MDPFDTALDYVQEALSAMQARGVELRAAPELLAQLSSMSSSPAAVAAPPTERPAVLASSFAPRAPDRPVAAMPAKPPAAASKVVPILPFASEPPVRTSSVSSMPSASGSKAERLAAMHGPVLACTKCPALVASRTQVVFGVGNPEAELMFVGEAPGEDEDLQGEPFVGKAGQLLTKMIEAMGFSRSGVYIANVLKCRPNMPPGAIGNRKPTNPEMQTCLPYLQQQISIIQPKVIVALGATAMEGLLNETSPMSRLRGRWHDFQGTPLMATYHPAYLLRNQSMTEKRKVWEDMLMVLEFLGKEITPKQQSFFLQRPAGS